MYSIRVFITHMYESAQTSMNSRIVFSMVPVLIWCHSSWIATGGVSCQPAIPDTFSFPTFSDLVVSHHPGYLEENNNGFMTAE